jgi:hypothetical protein
MKKSGTRRSLVLGTAAAGLAASAAAGAETGGAPQPAADLAAELAAMKLEMRKLTAERYIRDQLYRYQEAVNRADFAELERFFGDARIATVSAANPDELHGVVLGGKRFADGFKQSVRFYDGIPRVQYCASNPIVQFNAAADKATCHAYYFIFQSVGDYDYGKRVQTGEFPLQVIGCGRYLDTYVMADGAWKLTEREIYSDLSGDYSHHMAVSPSTSARSQGLDPQKADGGLRPTVQTGKISALRPPT